MTIHDIRHKRPHSARKAILPSPAVSGFLLSLLLALPALLAGCGWVKDEETACPAVFRLKFVYDYNIKFADAFAREVKSVNVWAFDAEGRFVWSGEDHGAPLADPGYAMDVALPAGRYDFVAWCGLRDNASFDLGSWQPATKEELYTRLNAISEEGREISDKRLGALFHAVALNEDYEVDPYAPTEKNVRLSLVKDTKDIRVLLQHLDGSPIDNRDFSATITYANGWLGWDNEIEAGAPVLTYRPWNTVYGQTTAPGEEERGEAGDSRAVTTVSSLMFELSTSRLMADGDAVLTIRRNWDDTDIIRINLIDYLLLVMGHYGDISDQEYLDRQDDYSIVFFIDPSGNWYKAAGIFINNWAVVPPQDEQV